MKILITGGAGFIGSAVIRHLVSNTEHIAINVDKLTYSGNLDSLTGVDGSERYHFEHADICDEDAITTIFNKHLPDAVMHFAAESHVDRSIDGPAEFVQTNIVGTYTLLHTALRYWESLESSKRDSFRFHHVSTDEVYGSLGDSGYFTELTPYAPNSPYAASKAASDHLVRAWWHTYHMPVVTSNCSNNYGPYQFPEKLIPLIILKALEGEPLPIYGEGSNIRDWLYVDDHVRALLLVLKKGKPGETYNIGGYNEKTNKEVVSFICELLDEMIPDSPFKPHTALIEYVADRPGHDKRYAIDASKVGQELGWRPQESFESGIRKTVKWYLDHQEWCSRVQDGTYQRERIGLRNT